MEFVAVIVLWLVTLGVMLNLAARVLGPLEQKAKHETRRLQFTLGDWVCLVILIQAWAAIAHSFFVFVVGETRGVLIADAFGWVLVVILWLGAVWQLTAAGLRNVWHRAAALLFVYPLVVLGAAIVPFLLAFVTADLITPSWEGPPAIVSMICTLSIVLIVGGTLGARQLMGKIVAATESDLSVEDAIGSREDGQRHETRDPEHGQHDRDQK